MIFKKFGNPAKAESVRRLNLSLAEINPCGLRRYRQSPYGMMNVVISLEEAVRAFANSRGRRRDWKKYFAEPMPATTSRAVFTCCAGRFSCSFHCDALLVGIFLVYDDDRMSPAGGLRHWLEDVVGHHFVQLILDLVSKGLNSKDRA